MASRLLIHLSTRRCRGCTENGFHTGHLTWLGRLRYTGGLRRRRSAVGR